MLEHLFFCCVVRFWIQISLNSISCIWLELGRKRNRSIEESLKPKPRESKTQSGPLPQPNFLSFPSPRGPRTLPEPTHERPSLSPPRPIRARQHPARSPSAGRPRATGPTLSPVSRVAVRSRPPLPLTVGPACQVHPLPLTTRARWQLHLPRAQRPRRHPQSPPHSPRAHTPRSPAIPS